jgi:hypothetical protein
MNTITNTKKKRGRPPVSVSWPDGVFTVKDVMDSGQYKLSGVSIQLKINKAVRAGVLKVTWRKKSPSGRPRIQYEKDSY